MGRECEICGKMTIAKICPDCEQEIDRKVSGLLSNVRYYYLKRRGAPGFRQPLTRDLS